MLPSMSISVGSMFRIQYLVPCGRGLLHVCLVYSDYNQIHYFVSAHDSTTLWVFVYRPTFIKLECGLISVLFY